MKRRTAIRNTGWILQSAVFGPSLISAIQSCGHQVTENKAFAVLTNSQGGLANAIADTIIPNTGTPSASEVKVVEFMDVLLKDVFNEETVDSFLTGLQQFDKDCQQETGSSFDKLPAELQAEYLDSVDRSIMGESYQDEVPFYYTFKRLCITVYYSTEEGVKQNLDYQPVPGAYQGDVELKAGEKIVVGNQM